MAILVAGPGVPEEETYLAIPAFRMLPRFQGPQIQCMDVSCRAGPAPCTAATGVGQDQTRLCGGAPRLDSLTMMGPALADTHDMGGSSALMPKEVLIDSQSGRSNGQKRDGEAATTGDGTSILGPALRRPRPPRLARPRVEPCGGAGGGEAARDAAGCVLLHRPCLDSNSSRRRKSDRALIFWRVTNASKYIAQVPGLRLAVVMQACATYSASACARDMRPSSPPPRMRCGRLRPLPRLRPSRNRTSGWDRPRACWPWHAEGCRRRCRC